MVIMDGNERRKEIISYLGQSTAPINGTELAKHFGVSRQVIVQDMALLRAENKEILSTNKGYLLYRRPDQQSGCTGIIAVQHTQEQTLEEMLILLEYGGRMLDVFVDHDLYGQIRADLVINTKEDALEFCEKMAHSKSRPLKELTGDCHYHTIWVPSPKVLKLIRQELTAKGFCKPS